MKKFVLFVSLFCLTLGYTPIGLADAAPEIVPYVNPFVNYKFLSYPPQTYNGKKLYKVEKHKEFYVGWYR